RVRALAEGAGVAAGGDVVGRGGRLGRAGGGSDGRVVAAPAPTRPRATVERAARADLDGLYRDVALEIRARTPQDHNGHRRVALPRAVRRLRKQAPLLALEGVGRLSVGLRRLTGRDVIDLNAMMAIVQFFYQQVELAKRDLYEIDEFGFDREYAESFLPVFRWIY